MANFALIVICLSLGIALRASGRMPETGHLALNAAIINVALPALTFASVRHLHFEPALALAAAMPWLMFAVGSVFFAFAGRVFGFSRPTIGALILAGTLGNTSFVGLPMIETFFGRDAMKVGVVVDQLGSYLVLSTVGLFAAAAFAEDKVGGGNKLGKLLRFPPLQALVAALILFPVPLPAWVDTMLMRLGDMIAPLAMLSVGAQLRLSGLASNRAALSLGLGFKLVVAPLLLTPIYFALPLAMRETARITLFEAAMPPMIGAGIVAMQHKLNAPLVTLMLGIGIPLSLLTVPAWWFGLSVFG